MWARIRSEAFGTLTTTFQELKSLAADMDAKNVALDAELAPILAAEEERYMVAQGYVRGTDEPGKRWVKPSEEAVQISDNECCDLAAIEPCPDCPFPEHAEDSK